MDELTENRIVEQIRTKANLLGSYSIKEAAGEFFYENIPISEQKRLAKIVVRSQPFITEIKEGEVIVKPNNAFIDSNVKSSGDYDKIKAVVALLMALLGYIVFELLG